MRKKINYKNIHFTLYIEKLTCYNFVKFNFGGLKMKFLLTDLDNFERVLISLMVLSGVALLANYFIKLFQGVGKMKNVTLSKEMLKNIAKNKYYSQEDFIKDCKCYIKALKSGRLQYTVTHVSNSGMSRDIFIQSYEGTMTKGYFRTYFSMLKVFGYKEACLLK